MIVTSRGYKEDVRLSNIKLILGTIIIVVALVAQLYNKKFPENRDFLIGFTISGIVRIAVFWYFASKFFSPKKKPLDPTQSHLMTNLFHKGESLVPSISADRVEPRDNNTSEAKAIITRLTEEKNSAVQLNNKLQKELEMLKRESSKRSQSGGGIPMIRP